MNESAWSEYRVRLDDGEQHLVVPTADLEEYEPGSYQCVKNRIWIPPEVALGLLVRSGIETVEGFDIYNLSTSFHIGKISVDSLLMKLGVDGHEKEYLLTQSMPPYILKDGSHLNLRVIEQE